MASSTKDTQNSGAKKPGRFAQMKQAYQFGTQVDPHLIWWMLGAFLLVFALMLGLGFLLHQPIIWGIGGFFLALLAAVIVMSRRTDAGAYKMLEGKPGAALAALQSLRGGWYTEQQPIAVDGRPQGQDFTNVGSLYRTVGRAGVVLIGEGPKSRATKLMLAEKKKVERLVPGAPVHLLRVGEGEDTVPVRKLTRKVQLLRGTLTKEETAVIAKRLRSMDAMRQGTNIPAGMDPTKSRVNRSAMRGR